MTSILHLSDTHLSERGAPVSGRLDTETPFSRLLDRVQSARSQWDPIDAVLVTGDVSDDGSPDSYARFNRLTSALDVPLYVIPGNHDAREPMRHAFRDHGYLPATGPLNWRCHVGELCVIGLDSLVEGSGHGHLTDDTLGFLEAELAAAGDTPVVLALHHPPFHTGIAFMDAIGLRNATAFADVLTHATGAVRILCGHVHSVFIAEVSGRVAISAPAPGSGFEFDTRPDAPVGFFDQGDGALLHRWDTGFTTVRIGPVAGSGPHPFN